MEFKIAFVNELKHEAASTRKILERVPMDKLTWKPHEKSTELGKLAKHIAHNAAWISQAITNHEFDFAKGGMKPAPDFTTTAELLDILDTNVNQALKDLETANNEILMQTWTMRQGEKVFMSMPKAAVVRNFALNHSVHHRGQLTVYLRLLNIPVPGMYGPTADEQM